MLRKSIHFVIVKRVIIMLAIIVLVWLSAAPIWADGTLAVDPPAKSSTMPSGYGTTNAQILILEASFLITSSML